MTQEQICKKISSLLPQFIEGKVTFGEKEFIEEHIAQCPECYKKFVYLKNLVVSLKDSYQKIIYTNLKKQQKSTFNIREHENFIENLSPYVDNELKGTDAYEFRKYLIKYQSAQKELGRVYSLQKRIHQSFSNTKDSLDKDFSKEIAAEFREHSIYKQRRHYAKVAILAGILILGVAEVKHFYTPVKDKIHNTIMKKKEISDEIFQDKVEPKEQEVIID